MTRNPTLAVVVLALLALAPIAEGQDRDAPPDAGREIFKPGPIPSSGEPVTEDTLLAPDDVLQAQWRGQWWAARVLDALPDGQVEIHYIGWPSNFDEALPRIRLQIDPDAERMVVRNTFAPSRELSMRPLPAYRIGPPDILQIEIIPKGEGTARHQPSSCTNQRKQSSSVKTEADNIGLNKTGVGVLTLRGENIYTGTTTITDMGGLPNASVGTLKISGYACPIDEAKNYGVVFSSDSNPDSGTSVGWATEAAGPTGNLKIEKTGNITVQDQPVSGQYLVGPDGTINLRQYGLVQVMGKTIPEARMTLEKHLAKSLGSPRVSVEVLGFNSKVYYVIIDGGGMGDNVRRLPISGNETVLDAIAAVGGLSQLSGKKMWIARPSPSNPKKGTILPINYLAITRLGATATNYQILPGDRIFIEADSTIALTNNLSKKTAPLERALGLLSLTSNAMKMQGRKDQASSDQETATRIRKRTSRPDEIEAELTNAIYRCLQRMIPMLDTLGGGGSKPCRTKK